MELPVKLPKKSTYATKDQAKANQANKFIGRGTSRSSTEAYRRAYGELANVGSYGQSDIVFVSTEGARTGRVQAHYDELNIAVASGCRFVTDTPTDTRRPYNVGEREVTAFLKEHGYVGVVVTDAITDIKLCLWTKGKKQ